MKLDSTGLLAEDFSEINDVFSAFPEIEKAVLFGSRAKGTAKPASDVDLALFGNQLEWTTVVRVSSLLNEETRMPYHFDVLNFSAIENEALREHIERVGLVIFEREASAIPNRPVAIFQ